MDLSTGLSYIADPIDLWGHRAAAKVQDAGYEMHKYLHNMAIDSWNKQMQGLQNALGSMNNYNGVLSHLYGVPTNQYDPRNTGGVIGPYNGATQPPPASGPPASGPPPVMQPGAPQTPRSPANPGPIMPTDAMSGWMTGSR